MLLQGSSVGIDCIGLWLDDVGDVVPVDKDHPVTRAARSPEEYFVCIEANGAQVMV